jgi:hypothetical protein
MSYPGNGSLVYGAGHRVCPYSQRRLWFSVELEGPSPAQHVTTVLHLRGQPQISALRTALRDVAERHEGLRAIVAQDAAGHRFNG